MLLCVSGCLTGEPGVSDALRQVFATLASRQETRIIVVDSDCEVSPGFAGLDAWIAAIEEHLADRQFIYAGDDHLSMLLLYTEEYTVKHPSHVILHP